MRKAYEILEHTADIGIAVKGGDLEKLFRNAAMAMFDIMAEKAVDKKSEKIEKFLIRQEADDLEELFVNWLNELLSLSGAKSKIFCEFTFRNLDEGKLEAVAGGEDMANYRINTEIKAATYHGLEIKKAGSQWQAKVIFDV